MWTERLVNQLLSSFFLQYLLFRSAKRGMLKVAAVPQIVNDDRRTTVLPDRLGSERLTNLYRMRIDLTTLPRNYAFAL
jgi:hypothetical protein